MQFFISFCSGCILIGALGVLCPEGNVSKPVKYVFSLIFLAIVITSARIPLRQLDFPAAAVSQQPDTQSMQIASARYVFEYALKNGGINFSKISIFTDKSEDGSIVITKVVITTEQSREAVLKALGILAENREVIIENE